MFSLWVCPDCETIGRRFEVVPAVAGKTTHGPDGSLTMRPNGTKVCKSSWQCDQCGQIGALIESRETVVGEVIPGVVGQMKRRAVRIDTTEQDQKFERIMLFGASITIPWILGWALGVVLFG